MKKIYGSLLIIWLATSGMTYVFAEDTCDNAVDAADSMDLNQKECDYSDKGLNGFLQKAFKKGNEGAVLSTSDADGVQPQAQMASTAVVTSQTQNGLKNVPVLSVEVDQWANVALAKNQLLPKIMERCTKGFSLLNESYRSLPMGRIELSLYYSCL